MSISGRRHRLSGPGRRGSRPVGRGPGGVTEVFVGAADRRSRSAVNACAAADGPPDVPETGGGHELPAPGRVAALAVRGGGGRREQHHASRRRSSTPRRPRPRRGRRPPRRGGRTPGAPPGRPGRRPGARHPAGAPPPRARDGGAPGPRPVPAGSTPRSAPPRMTVSSRSGKAASDAAVANGLEARASSTKVRPSRSPTVRQRDGSPSNPSTDRLQDRRADGRWPSSSVAPVTAPHRFQRLCTPGQPQSRGVDPRRPVHADHGRGVHRHPTRRSEQRPPRVAGGPAQGLLAAGIDGQLTGRTDLDQAELVPVVGLLAPMPVEVVGRQAGQHHQSGADRHVGRLVGRDLDHVGVGQGPPVHLDHRDADVPDQGHVPPVLTQDGRGQRRGGALPLGAGDGHHPGVGEVLEPQGHGRGHRHPGGTGRLQLGAVPAHARAPGPPPRSPTTAPRPGRPPRGRLRQCLREPVGGRPRVGRRRAPGLDPAVDGAAGPWPALRSPSPTPPPDGRTARRGSRRPPPSGAARPTSPRRRERRGPARLGRGERGTGHRPRRPGPRPARPGPPPPACPATRARDERRRRAAADSRRSPTHSNGLSSSLIRGGEAGDLVGVGEQIPSDDGGQAPPGRGRGPASAPRSGTSGSGRTTGRPPPPTGGTPSCSCRTWRGSSVSRAKARAMASSE